MKAHKRQHTNHGLVASSSTALLNPGTYDFGCSLCLKSSDHRVSGAVQARRTESTRTDNHREVSDPPIIQGCLGHVAKSIIGSRDVISFHKGPKS